VSPSDWTGFVLERLPELWLRTGEHLVLTTVSTAFAIAAGIPLGILALRARWLRGPLLGAVGILQTIPSLAMLAILLALLRRIGAVPAVIALTLYALLPIVRNTLAGLEGVSAEVVEAARGIGMSRRQELWLVRIPLARPVIVAGIRTAAVVGVGIATLSAFIGAGGLGQFINRGLALSHTGLILLGAIPAGILALMVDFSLGAAGWGLEPVRRSEKGSLRARLKRPAVLLPLALAALGPVIYLTSPGGGPLGEGRGPASPGRPVRVGGKNFTEQLILGEMMALVIEERAGAAVERRFNLGGTMICHRALVEGEIDVYAEYTGTGLTAILSREAVRGSRRALGIVRREYRQRFGLVWLEPFGFDNTYSLTVRREEAERRGWSTVSDLEPGARGLRAGFTAEFSEREDGYPGLQEAYGFSFGEVTDLDPAILYEALARDEVDVICAFATDGRIPAYDLMPLEDDRNFFPPYQAAPVARAEILHDRPEVAEALGSLGDLLDDETMQRLNFQVDDGKRSPAEVAREFLVSRKILDRRH
jgi:osmoprotectant transport system permease protein